MTAFARHRSYWQEFFHPIIGSGIWRFCETFGLATSSSSPSGMSDIQENIAHGWWVTIISMDPLMNPIIATWSSSPTPGWSWSTQGPSSSQWSPSSQSPILQGTKYKIDKFEFGTKYKIGRPKSFFYKFEFVGDQDVETVCGFQVALINRQKLSLRSV